MFVLATLGLGDDLVIAIGAVPGDNSTGNTVVYAGERGKLRWRKDLHKGTTVLVQFLHIKGDTHALDEVVRALKGKSTLIVESAVARLKKTVESPKISMDSAMIQLSLLMKFAAAPKHHPLWLALPPEKSHCDRDECPFRPVKLVLSLQPQGNCSPDSTANVRHCISICFEDINSLMVKSTAGLKPALQALEAGVLTALAFSPA